MKEKYIKYLKFITEILYTIVVSIICLGSIMIINYIVFLYSQGSDLEGFSKGMEILSILLILTSLIKIVIIFYEFIKKE